MADEVGLNQQWSLSAYIAHNEAMRVEAEKRYEERFVSQDDAVKTALISAKEATAKFEAANEKRFEGVNEFRATLSDQAATFISRTEVDQQVKALDDKIDLVTGRMDRLEGRTGGSSATWAYAIAAIGVAGTIVGIIGGIVAVVVILRR
jgi:hypothetical protein